jgi:hypothetical protein
VLFTRVRIADLPSRLGGTTALSPAPLASALELAAWPQPARDHISVRLRSAYAGSVTLQLTDLLGRILQRQNFHSDGSTALTTRLQLSALSPGVYHLVLRTHSSITATSILITR